MADGTADDVKPRNLRLDIERVDRFGVAVARIAEQTHFCGEFVPSADGECGWRFHAPNGISIEAGDKFSAPKFMGRKDGGELTVVAGNAFFGWQAQFEIPFFIYLEDLPKVEAAVAAYNEAFKDVPTPS